MRYLALLTVLLALVGGPARVFASTPPGTPTSPTCPWCSGPPPPPTPVPTAPIGVAPDLVVVQLALKPAMVHRGQTLELTVEAENSAGAVVVTHVKYHSGHQKQYKKKLSDTGKVTFTWKVSDTAPLGKGVIHVKVVGSDIQQPSAVTFTVVK